MIAQTRVNSNEMLSYLQAVGGQTWWDRRPPNDGDALTEFAGRHCYKSWAPGLNPNVRAVRSDSKKYIDNIIESEHGSVLEHTQVTFMFHNVSRVFTHELVRHRVGIAISQESLRFVRLDEIGFHVPEILAPMEAEIVSIVERLEEFQRTAAVKFGLDDAGVPFHYKKKVTSALRRLAPLGLSTGMVWSTNLRTLRFVLGKRTEEAAEEEIRLVFDAVGKRITDEYPILFSDFSRSQDGVWSSPHSKA